jgi:UDP-N-acetylglucosamine/UDP-N-acetylgalactosamine diphosphorylase
MNPDGNGGVFAALERCGAARRVVVGMGSGSGVLGTDSGAVVGPGALADLNRRGVEYVHFYGVDNCLVRVGDPVFVGFAAERGADAAAKVVAKAYPAEPVGVFALRNHRCEVVEYSEIAPAIAEVCAPPSSPPVSAPLPWKWRTGARVHTHTQARDAQGRLLYNAGNIANHAFSVAFLNRLAPLLPTLPYHVARKKIPCIDEHGAAVEPKTPNGIKLEVRRGGR